MAAPVVADICPEGKVGVVPETDVFKRVCRNADLKFESTLPLTTTLSNPTGFAALTGGFAIQKDGTYTASALVGSEVVGAAVNAELAGYKLGSARSSGMASKNFPATFIEGVLRSTMIYHDDVKCSSYSMGCTQADLKVSFQLRDNITFSVGVPKTKVEVELRPLSTSSKVQTVKFVRDCSGEICHLNDLRLTNVAVFSKLSGDEKFGVHYRIQSVGSFVHLGDTTVVPPPSKTIPSSTIDTVYTVLPSRVLFPGDTFDLQVRSRFKVYLHSAEIQVVVGAGLRIQSVAVPAGVFDKDQIDPTPLGNSASKAYAVMACAEGWEKRRWQDDGRTAAHIESAGDISILQHKHSPDHTVEGDHRLQDHSTVTKHDQRDQHTNRGHGNKELCYWWERRCENSRCGASRQRHGGWYVCVRECQPAYGTYQHGCFVWQRKQDHNQRTHCHAYVAPRKQSQPKTWYASLLTSKSSRAHLHAWPRSKALKSWDHPKSTSKPRSGATRAMFRSACTW